jgi:hypothetical protein
MQRKIHVLVLVVLGFLAVTTIATIAFKGGEYYTTPLQERPFHPLHEDLKPTGPFGHGFGIVGTLLILSGVTLYSSRKRLRIFSGFGNIRYILHIHMLLCLFGPALVLFHTTFKFGGLVAVSFWSMSAVVASGVIGRYLYVQIPKEISGNSLSIMELQKEFAALGEAIKAGLATDASILEKIDAIARPPDAAGRMGLLGVLRFFVVSDLTRRTKQRLLFQRLRNRADDPAAVKRLRHLATRRIVLGRRIAFLEQIQQLFHYWHVIHLPFSIVMVVILFIHVGVAIVFGYRWIW